MVAQVRQAYGISEDSEPRDVGGSGNLNLLFGDPRDGLLVRMYRRHVSVARVRALQEVRARLADLGLPVPRAVATVARAHHLVVDGHVVEAERYVPHDAVMSSWERVLAAAPVLGRLHSALDVLGRQVDVPEPTFANAIDAAETTMMRKGADRIRSWPAGTIDATLADSVDLLIQRVAEAEGSRPPLPRQLVHGDFCDDNVLFQHGRVVLVTDLDFVGTRPRIDDVALTWYFAEATLAANDAIEDRLDRFRPFVEAYDSGLAVPLSDEERARLPLALARQPLWGVGRWVAELDDHDAAASHAVGLVDDVARAHQVFRNLRLWQSAAAA